MRMNLHLTSALMYGLYRVCVCVRALMDRDNSRTTAGSDEQAVEAKRTDFFDHTNTNRRQIFKSHCNTFKIHC